MFLCHRSCILPHRLYCIYPQCSGIKGDELLNWIVLDTKCHNKNIRCCGDLAPRLVDFCSWYQLDSVFRDVIHMSLSAVLPIIMEKLERYRWMQKIQPLHAPFQVMAVGCLWVWTVIYCYHKRQKLWTLSLYDIRTWLFTFVNTKPTWVTKKLITL